jgi:hypothetical protein
MKKIKKYFLDVAKNLKRKIEFGKKTLKNISKHSYFKNRRRNIVVLTIAIILILIILLARFIFVAALVNGWPVSRIKILQGLEKQYGQEVLDNLISRNLVYQEARNLKISISQTEIDDEIKAIEDILLKQNVTLEQALISQGLTQKDLEDQIKFQKTVEAILTSKINISDEEIKDYFAQNKDYFDKGATLETVKDQIEEQLFQDKLTTEYQTWISDLKVKAKIRYFVNY